MGFRWLRRRNRGVSGRGRLRRVEVGIYPLAPSRSHCPGSFLNLQRYKTLHQSTQRYLTSPGHSTYLCMPLSPQETVVSEFLYYVTFIHIHPSWNKKKKSECNIFGSGKTWSTNNWRPEDNAGKVSWYSLLFPIFFRRPVSWVSYTTSLSWYGWTQRKRSASKWLFPLPFLPTPK